MQSVQPLIAREPLKVLAPAARVNVDPAGPSVSVVIPTLNEARNLEWLARHMPTGVAEILLVDGNSTDATPEVAKSLWPDVRIVAQTRRGKGNALACGFEAATGDVIAMIDADGSMDPGEIPYFVDALCAGADYAKGSRFATGGGSSDITFVRSAGNRALNGLTNTVHGSSFTDLCYGYNAFWRSVLPVLGLDAGRPGDPTDYTWGDGFEIETLMNVRAHAAGLRIAEVASFESERRHGTSNLNTWSDGLRVLRTIAVERARMVRRPATIHVEVLAQRAAEMATAARVVTGFPVPAARDERALDDELLEAEALDAGMGTRAHA